MKNYTSFVKIALLTNIPTPYREKLHESLNNKLGKNYMVFYCARTEQNRLWTIEKGKYNKFFLRNTENCKGIRKFYFNIGIIRLLNKYNPDVVITSGFPPTMLLAFIWAKLKRKKHIAFTDGTIQSESNLTSLHYYARKFVFSFTDAFIGASKKSLALYSKYKINNNKLFLSPLCINNEFYRKGSNIIKKYDIIFSGQFIDRKMPFFFVEVIRLVNKIIPCKIVIIGDGILKQEILEKLAKLNINYCYPGFMRQDQLPYLYGSSKVLLFPTKNDPWGVVANEACASGIPVITCANAGAANELIIHGFNGYVLPLNEEIWASHVINLLSNQALYKNFAKNALLSVQKYNYKSAVKGILDAVYSGARGAQ